MAINNKVKVPVVGAANKSILLNPQATEGAVFGKDLFFGDGSTVVTLQNLATALGITKASAQPTILWNQLAAIPPNVIQVANLATAGVVRRLPDGTWITQPPSDFIGRPGIPGRHGVRGPPGVPGAAGVRGVNGSLGVPGRRGTRGRQGFLGPQGARGATGAQGPAGVNGSFGIPGRRGARGRQGFIGPQGAQGATGAQGPAGAASTASGFPGYRQKPVPKQRITPWFDPGSLNVFRTTQIFAPQTNVGPIQVRPFPGQPGIKVFGPTTLNTTAQASFVGGTAAEDWRFGCDISGFTASSFGILDITSNVKALELKTTGEASLVNTVNITAGSIGGAVLKLFGTATGAANTCFIEFRDSGGTRKGYVGDAGGGESNMYMEADTAGASIILNAGSAGTVQIQAAGGEYATFNGAVTTGTSTPSMAAIANKPGTTSGNQIAKWLPVSFGGTQYYIPMWVT